MPDFNTNITSGDVDEPIELDASYPGMDATDRRKIDDQILGGQTALAANLLNGVIGTFLTLDGASAAVNVGDNV